MLDIDDLVDGIVTTLKDIPALMTPLQGEPNNVVAYKDSTENNQLYKAVFAMKRGSVMAAWRSTGPGLANEGYWRHRASIYISPGEDPDAAASKLIRAILSGVVTSSGLRFILTEVAGSGRCYTPADVAQVARVTNPERVDTFEITLFYTEIGFPD